jgi:hypothetical protein
MGATKFWLALGVVVLVYQVELNVLVPGVLGKEMRLHPVNIFILYGRHRQPVWVAGSFYCRSGCRVGADRG